MWEFRLIGSITSTDDFPCSGCGNGSKNICEGEDLANFTNEIKRDLVAFFPTTRAGSLAAMAAFLSTSGTLTDDGFEIVSENERVAEYFQRLAEGLGIQPQILEVTRDPKRKRDKLTFYCGGTSAEHILRETRSLREHLEEDEDAALCYLRAAFLGGGSCTLPRDGASTGYHLECVFFTQQRAEEFCNLLSGFELFGKLVARGDTFVAYVKSREAISDVLSVLGADHALKKLDAVSAARARSNNRNRIQNCMAGNADKAAIASAAQTVAVKQLQASGRLQTLPEQLRITALARLENPTLSLSELAELLGVSKGGLNHRMRRLMQLYGENTHD